MAARKEHEREMLFLESQLKKEVALQESQLRARLAKRHAEKQREKLALDVRGPTLSPDGKRVVKLERTPQLRQENAGGCEGSGSGV
jgi:hypothetical protein